MKLDELKPLWKSYKKQTGKQYQWSTADFEQLLEVYLQQPIPWYKRSSRILINACMSLLLVTLTGC